MQKFRWLAILMGITILGITGFQGYWLKNNYDREKLNLELKTNADFKQTILFLQASKLKLESLNFQLDTFSSLPAPAGVFTKAKQKEGSPDRIPGVRKEPPITMMNLLQEKIKENGMDQG